MHICMTHTYTHTHTHTHIHTYTHTHTHTHTHLQYMSSLLNNLYASLFHTHLDSVDNCTTCTPCPDGYESDPMRSSCTKCAAGAYVCTQRVMWLGAYDSFHLRTVYAFKCGHTKRKGWSCLIQYVNVWILVCSERSAIELLLAFFSVSGRLKLGSIECVNDTLYALCLHGQLAQQLVHTHL